MGLQEEIEALEEEIRETPYNKSTEEHIGRLKAKVAEKKEQLEKQAAGSGGGGGYGVQKTGDATVALVGFPSVGKSTLLNALTNAESDVGAYEFTTLQVNPGMLKYRGADIQLLDIPGLIKGASAGRGRGREVLSVVRAADLIVFVLSPFEIEQYEHLREELRKNKVRLDQAPPNLSISESDRGGIKITASVDLDISKNAIREVLREQGIVNAHVAIREDIDLDRLVDGVMDNRIYLPSITVVNKIDLIEGEYEEQVTSNIADYGLDPDQVTFVSAETGDGLSELKARIWETLGLIRVYLDKPGRGPDFEEPLILTTGATVEDACEELGGPLKERFRFARVSGSSAKYEEQQVGLDHELADEDVLRIVTRR